HAPHVAQAQVDRLRLPDGTREVLESAGDRPVVVRSGTPDLLREARAGPHAPRSAVEADRDGRARRKHGVAETPDVVRSPSADVRPVLLAVAVGDAPGEAAVSIGPMPDPGARAVAPLAARDVHVVLARAPDADALVRARQAGVLRSPRADVRHA